MLILTLGIMCVLLRLTAFDADRSTSAVAGFLSAFFLSYGGRRVSLEGAFGWRSSVSPDLFPPLFVRGREIWLPELPLSSPYLDGEAFIAFGWRSPGRPHARSGVPTPGGVRPICFLLPPCVLEGEPGCLSNQGLVVSGFCNVGWRLPGSLHARSGVPTPGGVRAREGWQATGPDSYARNQQELKRRQPGSPALPLLHLLHPSPYNAQFATP